MLLFLLLRVYASVVVVFVFFSVRMGAVFDFLRFAIEGTFGEGTPDFCVFAQECNIVLSV